MLEKRQLAFTQYQKQDHEDASWRLQLQVSSDLHLQPRFRLKESFASVLVSRMKWKLNPKPR